MSIREAALSFYVIAALGGLAAQAGAGEPAEPVRISGRVVSADGRPISFAVRKTAIDGYSTEPEATIVSGPDGRFAFSATRGRRYRIALAAHVKMPPKTVDASGGEDIDLGDLPLDYCASDMHRVSGPPPASVAGNLRPEQIVIEERNPAAGDPFLQIRPQSGLPLMGPKRSINGWQCWEGPRLANGHSEWEWECGIQFDRDITIESFLGDGVKLVRVVRHEARLTPKQIRDEVRSVWSSLFADAYCQPLWAEVTLWNIEASVEYEDGKRALVLTDGWHIEVQDREGKQWFTRLAR